MVTSILLTGDIHHYGYNLGRWNLDKHGCCKFCGARLAGHFDPEPDHWGSRRRQLFIGG